MAGGLITGRFAHAVSLRVVVSGSQSLAVEPSNEGWIVKKIILTSLSVVSLALSAITQAAIVTVGGVPDGTSKYENETTAAGLGSNANGEELIWLGLNETPGFDADTSDNIVSVHLQNLHSDGRDTGAISLVLSNFNATRWDFDIDPGVQLKSIFIFSSQDRLVDVSDRLLNIDLSGVPVWQSAENSCAYSIPYDFEGCNTDEIMGTNQSNPLEFGLPTNPANSNFLADLMALRSENPLLVSNFNGAHFASSFTVGVDSTAVVPVPAALLMYLSALGVCVTRKLVR